MAWIWGYRAKTQMTTLPQGTIGKYLLAILRAGIFCLGASILVAILLESQIGVNPPGEIAAIIFWTRPFATGLALATPLLAKLLFSRLSRLITYPLAVLLGFTGGFIWAGAIYTIFINPYYGTFSIPVFLVWGTGKCATTWALEPHDRYHATACREFR